MFVIKFINKYAMILFFVLVVLEIADAHKQNKKFDFCLRHYDSKLGRFTTPDPFVPQPDRSEDWNRYSYVRNHPLKAIDPSGHFPEDPDSSKTPWRPKYEPSRLVISQVDLSKIPQSPMEKANEPMHLNEKYSFWSDKVKNLGSDITSVVMKADQLLATGIQGAVQMSPLMSMARSLETIGDSEAPLAEKIVAGVALAVVNVRGGVGRSQGKNWSASKVNQGTTPGVVKGSFPRLTGGAGSGGGRGGGSWGNSRARLVPITGSLSAVPHQLNLNVLGNHPYVAVIFAREHFLFSTWTPLKEKSFWGTMTVYNFRRDGTVLARDSDQPLDYVSWVNQSLDMKGSIHSIKGGRLTAPSMGPLKNTEDEIEISSLNYHLSD